MDEATAESSWVLRMTDSEPESEADTDLTVFYTASGGITASSQTSSMYPNMRFPTHGSWEYPLTRQEKMQLLFQTLLEEADTLNNQYLSLQYENEALWLENEALREALAKESMFCVPKEARAQTTTPTPSTPSSPSHSPGWQSAARPSISEPLEQPHFQPAPEPAASQPQSWPLLQEPRSPRLQIFEQHEPSPLQAPPQQELFQPQVPLLVQELPATRSGGSSVRGDEENVQVTPLRAAVRTGNVTELSRLLQEGGLDVNELDSLGETPLFAAVEHGSANVIACLLVHGADPYRRSQRTGQLPADVAEPGTAVKALLEIFGGSEDSVDAAALGVASSKAYELALGAISDSKVRQALARHMRHLEFRRAVRRLCGGMQATGISRVPGLDSAEIAAPLLPRASGLDGPPGAAGTCPVDVGTPSASSAEHTSVSGEEPSLNANPTPTHFQEPAPAASPPPLEVPHLASEPLFTNFKPKRY